MNPQATNYPISRIKSYVLDELLDLSPSFQRKPVWSDAQASYLIDSILNEMPVPEIFMRTSTDSEGRTKYEVVDGQQRLRSIIKFYTGGLVLCGDEVSDGLSGLAWDDLDPDQQKSFWAYKLTIREFESVPDSEVRDMFKRLNANQSNLNDQELRHAQYHGKFISLMESIADDEWWTANKIVTPAQVRRMQDVEFIAELMVGIMAGPMDKKRGLDEYFSDYDDNFPDEDLWRSRFAKVRKFTEEMVGGSFKGWSSKTEFYSLFLAADELLNTKGSSKNAAVIAAAMADFRGAVDKAKRKNASGRISPQAKKYAEAATRASTDLSRRIERIELIHEAALEALSSHKKATDGSAKKASKPKGK